MVDKEKDKDSKKPLSDMGKIYEQTLVDIREGDITDRDSAGDGGWCRCDRVRRGGRLHTRRA